MAGKTEAAPVAPHLQLPPHYLLLLWRTHRSPSLSPISIPPAFYPHVEPGIAMNRYMEEQGEQDAMGWTRMATRERSCRSGEIREGSGEATKITSYSWLGLSPVSWCLRLRLLTRRIQVYDQDKLLIVPPLSKPCLLTEEAPNQKVGDHQETATYHP